MDSLTEAQLDALTADIRSAGQIADRQTRLRAFARILAPYDRDQLALLLASLARAVYADGSD